MRRQIAVTLCFALACAGLVQAADVQMPVASAQDVGTALKAVGGRPCVAIAALEHDFGLVKAGEPLAWTFELANRGDVALEVTEVKPSCGCTKGDFDASIDAGKTGKITLTVAKTDKYAGPTVKTAKVTTNDPEHATFTLTLRAEFVTPEATPATE